MDLEPRAGSRGDGSGGIDKRGGPRILGALAPKIS